MLSKCFLILIFQFDLLSIQSQSQLPIPATPACGDKYPHWLLAAFGNLFMDSFYCTPKEIRALCILGKKNTPFKHPFFHGSVCAPCGVPRWPGTEWLSVELPLLSQAADSVSVWGIPVPGPNPQAFAQKAIAHTLFFLLGKDLCPGDSSIEFKKKKGGGGGGSFHAHPWLENSTWSLYSKNFSGSFYWAADIDLNTCSWQRLVSWV